MCIHKVDLLGCREGTIVAASKDGLRPVAFYSYTSTGLTLLAESVLGKQGEDELDYREKEIDVLCNSSLFASVSSTNNGGICLLYGDAGLSRCKEYGLKNLPGFASPLGLRPKACFFEVSLANQSDASCIVQRQSFSGRAAVYGRVRHDVVGVVLAICVNEYCNAVGVISVRGSYCDSAVSNSLLLVNQLRFPSVLHAHLYSHATSCTLRSTIACTN